MARLFNIEINRDYGWEIEVADFKGTYEEYNPVKEAPVSFALCVKLEENIMAIYDPFVPKDEAIKEANELDIFVEECIFQHGDNSFEGSFVDAFIYIQKYYKEELYND